MTPPAVVTGRQVEELQGPSQRLIETVGPVPLPRHDGAVDFAPHMSELLGKGERPPPAGGKFGVARHLPFIAPGGR